MMNSLRAVSVERCFEFRVGPSGLEMSEGGAIQLDWRNGPVLYGIGMKAIACVVEGPNWVALLGAESLNFRASARRFILSRSNDNFMVACETMEVSAAHVESAEEYLRSVSAMGRSPS